MSERTLASLVGSPGDTIRPAETSASLDDILPPLDTEPGRGTEVRLGDEIGRGGMGVVLRAVQTSLGREVAVKRPHDGASRQMFQRLIREARVMGRLEHPGIVPVHALGADEHGQPLLVMKVVEGQTWAQRLRRTAGRPEERSEDLEILVQLCRAVQFAHDRGVIHRDLKPENVLLGAYGEVVLTDWGLACPIDEPRVPEMVGTPAYAAPEMLDSAAPLGPATDVFLLGACLTEVLTGAPRNRGDTVQHALEAARACLSVDWPDGVPEGLARVADRACARDPSDRLPSAEAFAEAVSHHLRHGQALALLDAARTRLGRLEQVEERAEVESLLTEARFACRQAEENGAAPEDVAPVTERLRRVEVEVRLRLGDVGGATSALAQVTEADPALVERVQAAALEVERRAALVRDLDPAVSALDRNRFLRSLVGIGATVAIVAVGLAGGGIGDETPATGVAIMVAFLACVVVALWTLRHALLASAVNRTASGTVLAVAIGSLVNRLVAWRLGSSLAAMFTADLLLLALGTTTAALAIRPRLAWLAAPYVVGVAVLAARPSLGIEVFLVAVLGGFAATAIAWSRGV